MKQFLGLLLSLLLVLGTIGFPAAVTAEETEGTKTILDFNDDEQITAFGMTPEMFSVDGTQIKMGKLTTIFNSGNNKSKGEAGVDYWFADHGISTDFSNYRKFNILIYVPEATEAKFSLNLDKSKDWNASRIQKENLALAQGWQTISIFFKEHSMEQTGKVRAALGPEEISRARIWLEIAGEHTVSVGVSKIWLSEAYGPDDAGVSQPPDGYVVADYTTDRQVELAFRSDNCLVADKNTQHLGSQSTKYVPTIKGHGATIRFKGYVTPSQYKYFNIMMRSTGTHGQNFALMLFPYSSKDGGQSNNGMGSDVSLRAIVTENWNDSNWHILSVPVSDFVKYKGDNPTLDHHYGAVYFGTGWGASGFLSGLEYNIDMIWFSNEKPEDLKLVKTNPQPNYDDMTAAEASVTFTFNNTIKSVDETKLTGALKKLNGEAAGAVTCKIDGKTLTITANETLEEATEYTLTIPENTITDTLATCNTQPITYVFATPTSGLNAAVPTLTDGNGTQLTAVPADGIIRAASLVKSRGLADEKMATLVLAAYDANNCMVAFDAAEAVIQPNGDEKLVTEIPAAPEITIIKAFVIDNFFSLSPLQNSFTQLPAPASGGDSQAPGTQTASVTLNSAKLDINQLFIDGKVDGALPRMTIIAVNGKTAEKPLFVYPFLAEGDGTFAVETVMPETAASGEYDVRLTARRIDGKQTASFAYISQQDQKTLLQRLNAADIQGEVTALLQAKRALLDLPENDVLFAHVVQVIFEQKPYDDYATFFAMAKQAESVLEKLNVATWSDYSALLEQYPMILNGGEYTIYYSGLNAAEKATINRQMVVSAPFESFAAFRNTFLAAVSDYENNKGNTSGSSGNKGGGSSGGKKGGSAVSLVSMPSELLPAIPGNVDAPPEPDRTEERFADLTAAEWARESVERLYVMGAIAAAEQFRPNDSVTREEFVKLAVETLGLDKSAATAEFADVDAAAWYAPYIAVLQSKGIVTGYADGRFGVGEQITRQDMAVMLSRILETMDVELSVGDAAPFTDDGEISFYARDAVYRMREAGVLNGMEDGSFAPAHSASRAQAAKLLCSLLDLLKQ